MIVIVGIPGCGKTSVLKEVQRAIPSLQVVNYGDKMVEAAGLQKSDRDFLRKMPVAKQKEIGLSAAKKILQESSGLTLVDTHALVRTEFGYCPGLPKGVLEILSPQVCAMVECAPSLIIGRRTQDSGKRMRDVETEEELALHQELSRSYICACCMLTGALFAPSIIIPLLSKKCSPLNANY